MRKLTTAIGGALIAAMFIATMHGIVQPAAAEEDGCAGVDVPSGSSIARASESHPAGTTFCLSGRYRLASPVSPREGQIFRGPAEIVGVNGNDTGFHVTTKNVHFFDLDMSGFTQRAIRCMVGTRIFGGRYHHNGVNGIGCGLMRTPGGGVIIGRVEVDHNGSEAAIGTSSAGIKLAGSPGSIVRASHIHDNVGNGIWYDVDSGSEDEWDIVARNIVTGNSMRGIFYEVSRGHVVIRRNTVTGNNTAERSGASGIGVSSSKNVTIWGNVVEANGVWAIRANEIDRGYRLSNVDIYDNLVEGELYGCHFGGVTCVGHE